MTTIRDHAWRIRQRLIRNTPAFRLRQFILGFREWANGADPARDHYYSLLKKGLAPEDATACSGFHPMDEWDTFFGRLTMLAMIATVVLILIVLTNTASAAMDTKDEARGAQASELVLVDLLNGETVTLSDGTRWGCMRMMGARK